VTISSDQIKLCQKSKQKTFQHHSFHPEDGSNKDFRNVGILYGVTTQRDVDLNLRRRENTKPYILYLTKHYAMKKCGEVEVQHHKLLTSALAEGEWSTSIQSHFNPRRKSPWRPLDRRVGESHSRSERSGEKSPCQYRESNPDGSACSLVTTLPEPLLLPVASEN
jgi:hypothetical protein